MTTPLIAISETGQVIGEGHPRAKLSDAEVQKLLDMRAQGWSLSQLARVWGLSKPGVASICRGRNRSQTAVTFSVPAPSTQAATCEPRVRRILDLTGIAPSLHPPSTGDVDAELLWPKPVPDPIPPLPPRWPDQEPGSRVAQLITWALTGASADGHSPGCG